MKTNWSATQPEKFTASTPGIFLLFRRHWDAVQAWHQRATLRAVLHSMKDHELRDCGITRGEIGYVARNGADPNGRDFRAASGGLAPFIR
jgi:uncharacterized protein YjiS (DUF1127 family)